MKASEGGVSFDSAMQMSARTRYALLYEYAAMSAEIRSLMDELQESSSV